MRTVGRPALAGLGMVFALVACAPDEEGVGERTAPILNGTLTSDTVGYAYVENATTFCSGTMLSPQWVLTAGHCIQDSNGTFFSPPTANVYLGTSTTDPRFGSGNQAFVNPSWWDPTKPAGQQFPKDTAYDSALIRLSSPFSTIGYGNVLVNQLANLALGAPSNLTCYGYGFTATNQTGGGVGQLQNASLTLSDSHARLSGLALVARGGGQDTGDMDQVTTTSSQQLYNGDSGGSCSYTTGSPNQIVGVNEMIDQSTNPITAYLTEAAAIQPWVEQTMHSSPQSLGVPSQGTPNFVSGVSVPSMNGTAVYVVAAYKGSPATLQMRAYSPATGASAYSTLSTAGLPASGINSKVALAGNWIYPGDTQVVMAVIGADQKMYVASLLPGFGPGSAWTSMQWYPAYWQFPAGTQPAIASLGNRIDVFGISTDSRLWWRYTTDLTGASWSSDWDLADLFMKFSDGPSVAQKDGTYYVVGMSDGTSSAPNTGRGAYFTTFSGMTTTDPGAWSGSWMPLGGVFLGPPAIAGWHGGLAIYGIGTDSNLYRSMHISGDSLNIWSPWTNLAKGPMTQPEGVSVNTSWSEAMQFNVIAVNSSGMPVEIDSPW